MCDIKKKRAKKALQNKNLQGLIALKSPRQHHYLKATSCCEAGDVKEGKITFRYCRSRVCTICNNIRTAKLINSYSSELDWERSYLVTLTCRNCTGNSLRSQIQAMKKVLYNCRQTLRRRGVDLDGIYTMEVTYNEKRRTYHPHFHMILSGVDDEICQQFLDLWRRGCTKVDLKTVTVAQDFRRVKDDSALLELFKYITKSLNENPRAVDTIIGATWGLRMVQPFGNIKAQDEEVEIEKTYSIDAIEGDRFRWVQDDWYSLLTGESLTELFLTKKPALECANSRGNSLVVASG